jgi:hypothetical protein
MKNLRFSLFFFITATFLSFLGWISYARFIYITSIDPDLSIAEYDQKYFSDYPSLLDGVNKANIATIIIIAASIVLITASGYLSSRFKVLAWIIQGMNIIVFSMLVMAYM